MGNHFSNSWVPDVFWNIFPRKCKHGERRREKGHLPKRCSQATKEYLQTHTHTNAYVYIYMCTFTCVCIHTYIYIYIHCTTLHCITLQFITLHCTTLHYITLHYTISHHITHHIASHYTALHHVTCITCKCDIYIYIYIHLCIYKIGVYIFSRASLRFAQAVPMFIQGWHASQTFAWEKKCVNVNWCGDQATKDRLQ